MQIQTITTKFIPESTISTWIFYFLTKLFCWFQLFRGRTASFSDREKSVGFIITAGATAQLVKSLPFHTWLWNPQETFGTSQKNIHCFRYKNNFTYTYVYIYIYPFVNLSTIIIQILEFFYFASFDFWGEIWFGHVQ